MFRKFHVASGLALMALLTGTPAHAGCPGDQPPYPAEQPASCPAPAPSVQAQIRTGLAALEVLGAEKSALLGTAVVAPESLTRLLAMLAAGASGDTLDAFEALLGTDAPAALDESAYASEAAVWLDEAFGIAPDYAVTLRGELGATLSALPLKTDPDKSVTAINGWASDATAGVIPALLNSLPGETELVLATAARFAAPWKLAFDPKATAPGPFTLASGEIIETAMMSAEFDLVEHGAHETATLVRLRYATDTVHADILLPADDAARKTCLATSDPCNWISGLPTRPETVIVSMPKIDIAMRGSLLDALEALGLGIAADASRSDFGAMTPAEADRGPMLAAIETSAALKIEEAGTKAVAAQAAIMTSRSALVPRRSLTFTVDRPYIVVIRHGSTGTPLFIAQVADPRGRPR